MTLSENSIMFIHNLDNNPRKIQAVNKILQVISITKSLQKEVFILSDGNYFSDNFVVNKIKTEIKTFDLISIEFLRIKNNEDEKKEFFMYKFKVVKSCTKVIGNPIEKVNGIKRINVLNNNKNNNNINSNAENENEQINDIKNINLTINNDNNNNINSNIENANTNRNSNVEDASGSASEFDFCTNIVFNNNNNFDVEKEEMVKTNNIQVIPPINISITFPKQEEQEKEKRLGANPIMPNVPKTSEVPRKYYINININTIILKYPFIRREIPLTNNKYCPVNVYELFLMKERKIKFNSKKVFTTKCTITEMLEFNEMVYEGCGKCKTKLQLKMFDDMFCRKCNVIEKEPNLYYNFKFVVKDYSSSKVIAFPPEASEKIIKKLAQPSTPMLDISPLAFRQALKNENQQHISDIFNLFKFQEINLKFQIYDNKDNETIFKAIFYNKKSEARNVLTNLKSFPLFKQNK